MTVFIDPNQKKGIINPKLHGQFIEFLGNCIDEGFGWVKIQKFQTQMAFEMMS